VGENVSLWLRVRDVDVKEHELGETHELSFRPGSRHYNGGHGVSRSLGLVPWPWLLRDRRIAGRPPRVVQGHAHKTTKLCLRTLLTENGVQRAGRP
jgi:hypothetical protein